MTLTLYQLDTFTNTLFCGNPAAVIPLQQWIDDSLMQKIALENNLSDTAFFVPSPTNDADYDIRWFTPAAEINLCGHATLATAFVLFNMLNFNKTAILFNSKSGILKIKKENDLIKMDFPSWKPERQDVYPEVLQTILGGLEIVGVYQYRDLLVELENEEAVKNCAPDFTLLKKYIDKLIITAKGKEVDFVSRFFAPLVGINEDPVTGSAHAQLIPFWSEKLNKRKLHAKQLSQRGGELWCEQIDEQRVTIAGNCVFFMKGEIEISTL